MLSTVAFSGALPLSTAAPRHRGKRCSWRPRPRPQAHGATMVLDSSVSQSAAREDSSSINRRLGIGNLWAEPAECELWVPPTPALAAPRTEDSYEPSDVVGGGGPGALTPMEGELTISAPQALPWDTTTGVRGMSYLQRRLRHLARRKHVLERSYEECRRITALFSKTFSMGVSLLSPEKRKATWAIYTWCRRTDDLVDGPRVTQRSAALRDALDDWGARLDDIFERRVARDHLDLALVDTVEKFPHLTPRPFHDMVAGMVMDVEQSRFATFDDLYLYCYRVAGTVGLMTLPIIGTRLPGRRGLRAALEPALALGVAFQLTNILRDVGEDRLRGRIYLPAEDLARFGYSSDDLMRCVRDERYRALMRFQVARARRYFKLAESGIDELAPDARLPVRASLDMYSQILDVLEFNDYDNFTKRAYVSKSGKLLTLPVSWMRVQEGNVWPKVADFCDNFKGRQPL